MLVGGPRAHHALILAGLVAVVQLRLLVVLRWMSWMRSSLRLRLLAACLAPRRLCRWCRCGMSVHEIFHELADILRSYACV